LISFVSLGSLDLSKIRTIKISQPESVRKQTPTDTIVNAAQDNRNFAKGAKKCDQKKAKKKRDGFINGFTI